MSEKYCYSTNEEEFHGEFDSREDAVSEAIQYIDEEPGVTRTVWTAVNRDAMYYLRRKAARIAAQFMEFLEEELCDDIVADDEIIRTMDRAALGNALLDALEKHATFHRYGAENVQEHIVVVPEDE